MVLGATEMGENALRFLSVYELYTASTIQPK